MDKEIIEKLKELKQLVDDGILTQEEFEKEKKQLLSPASPAKEEATQVEQVEVEEVKTPKPYKRNRFLDNDQPIEKPKVTPQSTSSAPRRSPRSIHIPLWDRSLVMNQSTPEEVIAKCDKKLLQGKLDFVIAGVLGGVFVYYCIEGGFIAILNAFVFALVPAVVLLITGSLKNRYKDLKSKFVGMSQAEFEFVQDTIRQKRADAKEAVITFANDFAEGVDQYATEYQRQTGSNFYSDIATGLMS